MAVKTVSLETAKALKEAGFRQNCSLWLAEYKMPEGKLFSKVERLEDQPKNRPINAQIPCVFSGAAPTTDELLEELPVGMVIEKISGGDGFFEEASYILKFPKGHRCQRCLFMVHEPLPEALAEMWLWLKKEGLL